MCRPAINRGFGNENFIRYFIRHASLPDKKRLATILVLYQGGNLRMAAETVDVCTRTVQRWLNRWNAGGLETLTRRHKCGRKRTISNQVVDTIIRPLIPMDNGQERPNWTVAELQRELSAKHNLNVPYVTLLRTLRHNGLRPEPERTNHGSKPDEPWCYGRTQSDYLQQSEAAKPETDEPWDCPWPRDYGRSLADYLRESGTSF
jgi:transposase